MTFWRHRRAPEWIWLTFAMAVCHAPPLASAQEAGAAPPGVPVSVTQVVRKDVPQILRALGTVQALQSVQLRSQVDGVLLKVPVAEGQDVKQGDVLAIIDPRPYQAILDAALARKQQDEAQLSAARADLARYTSLAAQKVASQQQLENTQAKAGQLTATIAADEAQINSARLNLAFCYITAPFDGRVGLRMVDPGNFVRSAEVTAVMPLAQLHPIAVTFTLPQDILPAIQKALAAGKPAVAAFSGDDKTELDKGTLLTIDNSVDATTGTIKLKAAFPNTDSRLWPGQFVNARLLIGVTAGALALPSAAVRHGQDKLFVYVVKPDNTVLLRPVEVARDDGVTAVIASGLEEGQTVVTDGQSRLQNGARISILNPRGINPPGGDPRPKEAANPAKQGG